ncbi:MAG: ABC transporter permease [Acidobacteriota bacterium]
MSLTTSLRDALSHHGIALDVRYALRVLSRQPGHTLVAVLTMALGIAAATVLFSVVNGVLVSPLPWPDSDRLVRVSETREGGNNRFPQMLTNASYLALAQESQSLSAIAAFRRERLTLSGSGETERLRVAAVTPSLFPLLEAAPLVGRRFEPHEEREPLVALSYSLWQQRFNGDEGVVGKPIQLDGRPYTVVAVMPRDFDFPDRDSQAWVPYYVPPVLGDNPNTRAIALFSAIGRLSPLATPDQATAESTTRARTAPDLGMVGIAVYGTRGAATVTVVPWHDAMTDEVRPALLVLLAGVGLLLAAATANVASVQLARATSRRREAAVRSALGAGAGRLLRQLLIENLIVGLAGGAIGLAMAAAFHQALPSLLPEDFPRLDAIAIDLRVALVALGLSLAAGLAFGLMPAWQTRRVDLVTSLSEDSLAPVGGGARSRLTRVRALVMAVQVAIACVLLIGASLLGRTFAALLDADRGYDPSNLLTAELSMPDEAFTPERRAQILAGLLERLRSNPAVHFAAYSTTLPLIARESLMGFSIPPRGGSSEATQVQAMVRMVSPGYFESLGMRIVAGRGFTETDTMTARPVIVVNRVLADRYLGRNPVGQELPPNASGGEGNPSLVVGIVDNVRIRSATDEPQPELYFCALQRRAGFGSSVAYLTIRTAADPHALVPTLRALVREQGDMVALDGVTTMGDRLVASLSQPRLNAVVMGAFAFFTLAIAGVGLFGVLSYSVAQRSRELGVRAALGATPGTIVSMVVRQGLTITVAGAAAGLVAAYWLSRLIAASLYGVLPGDPVSFAAAAALLILVALVSCAVPAHRAARVDPQRVLRAG